MGGKVCEKCPGLTRRDSPAMEVRNSGQRSSPSSCYGTKLQIEF